MERHGDASTLAKQRHEQVADEASAFRQDGSGRLGEDDDAEIVRASGFLAKGFAAEPGHVSRIIDTQGASTSLVGRGEDCCGGSVRYGRHVMSDQSFEVGSDLHVTVPHEHITRAETGRGVDHAASSSQNLRLVKHRNVGWDGTEEGVRAVMRVDHERREMQRAELIDDVEQGRSIADGEHGFGQMVREGSEPGSEPGAQDHGWQHRFGMYRRRSMKARFRQNESCEKTWPSPAIACYRPVMRPSLRARHLFAFVLSFVGVAHVGCGTDPVNPDGCEAIETARCRAAPACEAFGTSFDVEACERFYRDQCLKGLQSENDPGQPRIDACVRAVERAGACAKQGATTCNVGTREIADPCNLIVAPQDYTECGFLDDGFGESDAGDSPFQDASPDVTTDAALDAAAEASTEAAAEAAADAASDAEDDAPLDAAG